MLESFEGHVNNALNDIFKETARSV